MLIFLVTIVVVAAIMLGALRIILGWILPKTAVEKLDRGSERAFALMFQIGVVGMACLIIYMIYDINFGQ